MMKKNDGQNKKNAILMYVDFYSFDINYVNFEQSFLENGSPKKWRCCVYFRIVQRINFYESITHAPTAIFKSLC